MFHHLIIFNKSIKQMRKLLTLLTLFLTLVYGQVLAQNRTISGKVTSQEDGTGIPGATVKVKGTNVGTQTDMEGIYKLEVPADAKTLEISFVGYGTQSIEIGNQSTIDVKLVTDDKLLSEIVVVGYGEQNKKTLTSSITKVSGGAIANLATPSFDQQLAGRAAGVQITQPNGILGTPPVIRIRGTNSITGSSSPLIVVDGVPMISANTGYATNVNTLGDINPSDIESYEILKDGAATAIYGSRAAAGVILITTKKGKKNTGAKINFDTYVGVSNAINRFDLLNGDQFVTIANEKNKNINPAISDANLPARRSGVNTNWQDAVLRQGVVQNYALSFSGGAEKTGYFMSAGYTKQDGVAVANSMERFSARGSIDHQFNAWIDGGTSISFTRTTYEGLVTGANSLSGNIFSATRLHPNVPIYNSNHPTGYNIDTLDASSLGRYSNQTVITNNLPNIKFVLDNNKNNDEQNRLISNTYLTLKIPFIEGLKFKTQYGIDYSLTRAFLSWDPRHGDGRVSGGRANNSSYDIYRWNWQNFATYNKDFGKHTISLTAGIELQSTNTRQFVATGTQFSDRFFISDGLITNSYTTPTTSGLVVPEGFSSYVARANYAYNNKYLAGFSFRRDGISDMPVANRNASFFGASVGYRVSEEDFYKNSSIAKIVNDIKIRGSYGEAGNVNLANNFPYLGLFGPAQYGQFNGLAFSQSGNSTLRWEKSEKIDVGAEFGFFDNRLTFEVDYFRNNITDLVLNAPVAASAGIPGTGVGNVVAKNVGSMVNQGWEFAVKGDVLRLANGFRWTADLNFTLIKNEVTGLVKNAEGKDQPIQDVYHRAQVGNPLASFHGIEVVGVSPERGFPLVRKSNGRIVERDPRIANPALSYSFYTAGQGFTADAAAAVNFADVSDGGDKKILGSAMPTWYGGLTNSFAWKGFDLEIFLRFSGGNYVYNWTKQESLLNLDFANNGTAILNRWQQPGQQTDIPRIFSGRAAQTFFTGNTTSNFLEKGDFLRIQNIVFGYTFPQSLLGKTKNGSKAFAIRSLRVYAQAQNVATFTGYTGLDPELTTTIGNRTIGLDQNATPQIRAFTFGLNLGL
jgi:TonB-linked SusC/RagA family outer membrane protein